MLNKFISIYLFNKKSFNYSIFCDETLLKFISPFFSNKCLGEALF